MSDIERPDTVGAHRRAETIRMGLRSFVETRAAITEAFEKNDWMTLGYTSWQAYCDKEFNAKSLKLSAQDRIEAALAFKDAGMTLREIAAATGASAATIHRALRSDEDVDLHVSDETRSSLVNATEDAGDMPVEDAKTNGAGDPAGIETAAAPEVEVAPSAADDAGAGTPASAPDPVPRPRSGSGATPRKGDPEFVSTPAGPATREFTETLDKNVPPVNPWEGWQKGFAVDTKKMRAPIIGRTPQEVVERADKEGWDEFAKALADLNEFAEKAARLRTASTPDNVTPIRRLA